MQSSGSALERIVCPLVVVTVEVLIGKIGAVAEGAVVHNPIVAERRDHDDPRRRC